MIFYLDCPIHLNVLQVSLRKMPNQTPLIHLTLFGNNSNDLNVDSKIMILDS